MAWKEDNAEYRANLLPSFFETLIGDHNLRKSYRLLKESVDVHEKHKSINIQ
jgi:hypothetical protein